jgi:general L-amino acid transport system substrate-binding protein
MGGVGRIAAWAASLALLVLPAAAQSTLDEVRKRGELVCGVAGDVPGFSLLTEAKEWEGLDVEFCRALAAAALGDARKAKFVPLGAQQRFAALEDGKIDVLARNSTVTLQRAAGPRLQFAVINYYDGQGFVVPKHRKVDKLVSLRGGSICVTKGTTHEFNLVSWFRLRGLSIVPVAFDTPQAMYDAFFGNRCLAVSQDVSALASSIVRSGKAADYMMLPDVISKEPLGPYVRSNDDRWLNVVRWTQYAMLEAEERQITQNNVVGKLEAHDPSVRLFLGVTPGNGKTLGLDERWAFNIIRQVGNYEESFERNLGQRSPLGFARGLNALWSKGGLMYPPPFR